MAAIPEDQRLEDNDGLAHWAVQKWTRLYEGHPDYDDAVQEARTAMVRAARVFDEAREIRFGTLACICMRNQLCHWAAKFHKHGFGHVGERWVSPPVQLIVAPDDDTQAHDEWHTDPVDEYADIDAADVVRRALVWLHEERPLCAKALYLKYFRSMGQAEIAAKMRVSKAKVAAMLVDGRTLLKARIEAEQK